MHRHLGNPVVMHQSAPKYENMEDLVRMQPDIALSGKPSFGDPQGIQHGPHNVQQPHQDQPTQGFLAHAVEPSFHDSVMNCRHDSAQSESHEDGSAERTPFRFGELVPEAHHDARDSQSANAREIDDFRLEVAVETVVKPRDERSHYQKRDSAIIQFGKQFAYELRVTVESVEHEGKAQTDDGPRKERSEDDFLLEFYFDGGTHQEVHGNTYEQIEVASLLLLQQTLLRTVKSFYTVIQGTEQFITL